MRAEHILEKISRREIETMDCSAVLRRCAAGQPPADLRSMFGCVTFFLDGYDAHPDELWVIPEIRRFVRQWHELSPNWLYFAALDTEDLATLYLALLDSVQCIPQGGAGLCHTRYDTGELIDVLVTDVVQANALCHRLGFSDDQRSERIRAVMRYFRLPGGAA